MFEQSILPQGRRRTWSVGLAVVGQLLVVGLLVLIPLMYVQALPEPQLVSMLVAPPPPPPPPPPPAPAAAHAPVAVVRHFDVSQLVAPRTVPNKIAMIKDMPAPSADIGVVGGVVGGVPGGQPGGVLGSVLSAVPSPAPPPPPPPLRAMTPAPKPETPKIIHLGGNVEAARLVSAPQPLYPPLAKQARISGTVELKAIISADGRVQNLTVVSGNPLLVNAAVDAVRQWVYRPTYLNGKPVQVDTDIEVHFQLG
jgi:periplasmic protein TonB